MLPQALRPLLLFLGGCNQNSVVIFSQHVSNVIKFNREASLATLQATTPASPAAASSACTALTATT